MFSLQLILRKINYIGVMLVPTR